MLRGGFVGGSDAKKHRLIERSCRDVEPHGKSCRCRSNEAWRRVSTLGAHSIEHLCRETGRHAQDWES